MLAKTMGGICYNDSMETRKWKNKSNKGEELMQRKNHMVNYKFNLRSTDTVKEIMDYCLSCDTWEQIKCPPAAVFAAAKKGKKSTQIVIYKESANFTGENNCGAHFRLWDMQHDDGHIVEANAATPTCAELNFHHVIVGSDEVGTGERIKQAIVTAAAVTPEQMEELIRLNVTDSKEMKKPDDRIRQTGEILSGVTRQQAWEIFESGEKLITSAEGAFVAFTSRLLPNSEYDAFQKADNGKSKNYLIGELHAEVLNPMIQTCKPDYVVVDDFIENDKSVKEDFCRALNMEEEKLFLRTKADAANMAVSCASVISAYFSELYMEWLSEKIKKDYGIKGPFSLPLGNIGLAGLKQKLFEEGLSEAEAEEVCAKYTKTTFQSSRG